MKTLYIIILFFAHSVCLLAQNNWQLKPFQRKAFIQNKGQFIMELPLQHQNFEYCIDNDARVLFTKQGLTHVIKKINHAKLGAFALFMSEEKRERLQREYDTKYQFITMQWVGANPHVIIETVDEQTTSFNYLIGNERGKAYVEKCKGFSKLLYKNLYKGIDVEYFFTEKDGFKYNIIASEDADLRQLKMQYDAKANIKLINGNMIIKTLKGDIKEHSPITFETGNPQQAINSSFVLNNNLLSFVVFNPSQKAITIDPWVLTPVLSSKKAFDNGANAIGEVYVHGGSTNSTSNADPFFTLGGSWITEKYAANGTGAPIWSLIGGNANNIYFGDLLVDGLGNFYLCEGLANTTAGARTFKYDANANLIWISTNDADFEEHWRLALDCTHGVVVVGGGGTTNPTKNIAEININTGVLSNVTSMYATGSFLDMSGICVDASGKCYLVGSGPNNLIFTDATHNPIGMVPSGHPYYEIFNPGYMRRGNNGYNCMALSGSAFLYTFDGITLNKWDRINQTQLLSISIPNGILYESSGVIADNCNNVFVGGTDGVYRFDANLVQQEYKATPSAVYDVAFAPSGEIIASGNGYVSSLAFTVPPCILQSTHSFTNSCGGGATGAINLNVTGGTPNYTYSWFLNGSPIAANTGSISGLVAGTYQCIYTDSPCNSPQSGTVTVTILSVLTPTASFTFSPVCLGSVVNFTNTTMPLSNVNWAWDFDNDAIVDNTNQEPNNSYTSTGTYTVELRAELNGCFDSITQVVNVYPYPVATFTADSVCFGSPSHLVDASNGNGNPLTNFEWDFTNDNMADATGPNSINYTMPLVGNNNVNYTVTSTPIAGLTCKTATTINVYTHPIPVANFTFVNNCMNAQPNSFDASASTTSIGTIIDYNWNFGDTQTDNSPLPTTTNNYNLALMYNVTLTVTTNKGCTDTVIKRVEVYEKPLVYIASQPNVCLGSATTFTALNLPNSGTVTLWQWDIDNTTNSIEYTGQTSSHTYSTAGWQILNLTATTDKGCKDNLTRNVYINYVPKPDFIVDKPSGCAEHCVTFTDQTPAIVAPAQIINWYWNFGNDASTNSATGSNQAQCYTNTSTNQLAMFTITLTAKTDSGCVASATKPDFITVYPNPIAIYTITPDFGDIVLPQVHFTNQSIDYTKWYWTFGDGSKTDSVNVNPSYTYNTTEANSYQSQLIVINQYGCRDTAQLLVDIAPNFVFYIPNAFSPNEDNLNDGFIGVGIGITSYNMWIYERWGTLVYYTDDITKPWYGKVQGKQEDAPQNVYTWKVELKDVFGKKHSYVGHVTLLR